MTAVHTFYVEDAIKLGIPEAVILNNLRFWIGHNKANGQHEYEGRTWTYNSVKAFTELFPYMTENQIRRAIEHLVDSGVLMKGNHSENQYDRRTWYAFVNESQQLSISIGSQIHLAENTNGNGIAAKTQDTDINTDKSAAEAVISYLNSKTGSKFRVVASAVKAINARMKEGATIEEIQKVIDMKVLEWKGTDMEQYLTPETLFRPSKYNAYAGRLKCGGSENRFRGGI